MVAGVGCWLITMHAYSGGRLPRRIGVELESFILCGGRNENVP